MTHVYYWRRLGWKGRLCVVEARGALNSILIRFEDGERAVVSPYAVRRIAP